MPSPSRSKSYSSGPMTWTLPVYAGPFPLPPSQSTSLAMRTHGSYDGWHSFATSGSGGGGGGGSGTGGGSVSDDGGGSGSGGGGSGSGGGGGVVGEVEGAVVVVVSAGVATCVSVSGLSSLSPAPRFAIPTKRKKTAAMPQPISHRRCRLWNGSGSDGSACVPFGPLTLPPPCRASNRVGTVSQYSMR
jgi:hypothetical protein